MASEEVLKAVFPLVEGVDLASCMAVCKQWRDIAKDDFFWKCVCAKRWPSICRRPNPPTFYELYKTFYRRRHRRTLRPPAPAPGRQRGQREGDQLVEQRLRSVETRLGFLQRRLRFMQQSQQSFQDYLCARLGDFCRQQGIDPPPFQPAYYEGSEEEDAYETIQGDAGTSQAAAIADDRDAAAAEDATDDPHDAIGGEGADLLPHATDMDQD